jgi:hypothetical protein
VIGVTGPPPPAAAAGAGNHDLDDVEHWLAEARLGRFKVERLPFYLAGIPTYAVVGELAVAQVLVGELPRPEFPVALRQAASSF